MDHRRCYNWNFFKDNKRNSNERANAHEIGYYLWVPVVLFINGFIFRIPRIIWKKFEGGTVKEFYNLEEEDKFKKSITETINGQVQVVETEDKTTKFKKENLKGALVDDEKKR